MKQNRHILLHSANDNSEILIDAQLIIGAIKGCGYFGDFTHNMASAYTNIIVDTADKMDNFIVNESPDKVYNALKSLGFDEFGFIMLHDYQSNSSLVLNTNYIDTVYKDEDDEVTTININENDVSMSRLRVNESVGKVYNAIMKLVEN